MSPTFMDKANRDRAWKAAGRPGKRFSLRNQLTHPRYVEDYPDAAVQADNGFGNCHYKTHFAVLYSWQ